MQHVLSAARAARAMRSAAAALALILAAALSGPAPARAADTITLRLDWSTHGVHAPFFLALQRGWFKAADLDVKIEDGNGSTTTVQLRADDGFSYIELDPAGQLAKIKAPGGILLDGPVHTTETLQVDGTASFNGPSVSHNGVNIGEDHKHSGVTAGGANTGNPI